MNHDITNEHFNQLGRVMLGYFANLQRLLHSIRELNEIFQMKSSFSFAVLNTASFKTWKREMWKILNKFIIF